MRRWLEFHDSEFISLGQEDGTAILELDAYVHRWERLDTGWSGSGWYQRVRITVPNASVQIREPEALEVDEECRDIWEGTLRCGSVAYDQLVPLPFSFEGDSRLDVQMSMGRFIEITGDGVRLHPLGDPTFAENLRPELAPDEDGNCGSWH